MSENGVIAAIETAVPTLGRRVHDEISEMLQGKTTGHPHPVDLRAGEWRFGELEQCVPANADDQLRWTLGCERIADDIMEMAGLYQIKTGRYLAADRLLERGVGRQSDEITLRHSPDRPMGEQPRVPLRHA